MATLGWLQQRDVARRLEVKATDLRRSEAFARIQVGELKKDWQMVERDRAFAERAKRERIDFDRGLAHCVSKQEAAAAVHQLVADPQSKDYELKRPQVGPAFGRAWLSPTGAIAIAAGGLRPIPGRHYHLWLQRDAHWTWAASLTTGEYSTAIAVAPYGAGKASGIGTSAIPDRVAISSEPNDGPSVPTGPGPIVLSANLTP